MVNFRSSNDHRLKPGPSYQTRFDCPIMWTKRGNTFQGGGEFISPLDVSETCKTENPQGPDHELISSGSGLGKKEIARDKKTILIPCECAGIVLIGPCLGSWLRARAWWLVDMSHATQPFGGIPFYDQTACSSRETIDRNAATRGDRLLICT